MEASFKKLSHIFYQIYLMRKHDEIKILWFQHHEIIFHQRMSKHMWETYDIIVPFKRNWTKKTDIIISGEIWSSCLEFWKVVILKKLENSHSNLGTQPAVLIKNAFSKGEE